MSKLLEENRLYLYALPPFLIHKNYPDLSFKVRPTKYTHFGNNKMKTQTNVTINDYIGFMLTYQNV